MKKLEISREVVEVKNKLLNQFRLEENDVTILRAYSYGFTVYIAGVCKVEDHNMEAGYMGFLYNEHGMSQTTKTFTCKDIKVVNALTKMILTNFGEV